MKIHLTQDQNKGLPVTFLLAPGSLLLTVVRRLDGDVILTLCYLEWMFYVVFCCCVWVLCPTNS